MVSNYIFFWFVWVMRSGGGLGTQQTLGYRGRPGGSASSRRGSHQNTLHCSLSHRCLYLGWQGNVRVWFVYISIQLLGNFRILFYPYADCLAQNYLFTQFTYYVVTWNLYFLFRVLIDLFRRCFIENELLSLWCSLICYDLLYEMIDHCKWGHCTKGKDGDLLV